MKRSSFTFCGTAAWVLFLCFLGQIQAQTTEQQVDALFGDWSESHEVNKPGIALAIVKEGSCIYQKEFGMANLEYGIPLSRQAVFDLASVAKQFTGMAVAMLMEQGKLSLEDDIRSYLPEVPDFGTPITVEHLLYHTSGLRDIAELSLLGTYNELSAKVVLDMVTHQQALNFPPGQKQSYSNTGYVLLALIVERITHMPFRDWCQTHIFQPLDMNQTFFNDNPREIILNRAVAYYQAEQGYSFDQQNGMSLIGSSSLFSTTDDLIKWVQNFETGKVGGHKVRNLMQQSGRLTDGSPVGYGFGLSISTYQGLPMIQHSGASPSGFRTSIVWLPDQRLGLIILSNCGNLDPNRRFRNPILDIYLAEEGMGLANEAALQAKKSVQISKELLDRYVGDYLFDQEEIIKIRREGSDLLAYPEGGQAILLKAFSQSEFFVEPLQATLQFELGPEGKANRGIFRRGDIKQAEMMRIQVEPAQEFLISTCVGSYVSPELRMIIQVKFERGILILTHPKHGELPLMQVHGNFFRSPQGLFSRVVFSQNETAKITGLQVDMGSRATGIYFEKWR